MQIEEHQHPHRKYPKRHNKMKNKNRKLTGREQFRKWMERDKGTFDNSEETLTKIFSIAMDYRKEHLDLSLKELFSYAYIKHAQNCMKGDD